MRHSVSRMERFMNVVRHLSLGFVKLHCSIKYSALYSLFRSRLLYSVLGFYFSHFFVNFLNTLRCLSAKNNWNLYEKKCSISSLTPLFLTGNGQERQQNSFKDLQWKNIMWSIQNFLGHLVRFFKYHMHPLSIVWTQRYLW